MQHFRKYIRLTKELASEQIADGISRTVSDIVPNHISTFDFQNHHSALLLGDVQSGKTAHMMGILTAAADSGFEVFIVITTDSTYLQKQTLERALRFLDTFCVCGEQDDIRFFANEMRKPVVIILKKNVRVLETWKNHLASSRFLHGRPVFIADDEGDAASLNTKINKNSPPSAINRKISEIKRLSNSSFYLQTTATPQSLFLQEEESGHRPESVYYLKPGIGYLGGDFFYGTNTTTSERQIPDVIKITDEEELSDLREDEVHIPEGMQKAITSFLISAAHIHITSSRSSCNFLIHPSVKISDHEIIAERIGGALNNLLQSVRDDDQFKHDLKEAWEDLRRTKSDISDFERCYELISELLENEEITISIMNSKATADAVNFDIGTNIVVGGNSLGRGVTFPNLQTTYYCRKSGRPNADTFWQHCRAFGYNRDPGLARIFLPASLFKLFSELSQANNAIIEYIKQNGLDGLHLVYPKNIRPTRKNVVNKEKLGTISGGVNYFPSFPTDGNTRELDSILQDYPSENEYKIVDIGIIKNIVKYCKAESPNDWPNETYLGCIESLQNKDPSKSILIVRRNRRITKNTGTLLSPNDRELGDQFPKKVVLTMYRVDGHKSRGWDGNPLWIPNIKFPKDKFFYNLEE